VIDTIVLLSGGLDSAVALAAMRSSVVEALTVDYGQRHAREITSAAKIARHYGIAHRVVALDPVLFGGCALTLRSAELPGGPASSPDATYVPARNTVLLALAAARAESIGARRIVIGANADDAAGYPDCRREYIEAFRDVLAAGTLGHVWVAAPLLDKSKAQIVDLAKDLGVPTELTWSCYAGGEQPCGECGACVLREQATA
jgi:7-cyano-7-deazaguanine synthase